MYFEDRFFSGKLIRPRPLVYVDPNHNYLVILTAWGSTDSLNQILDNIKLHLQSVKQDDELTTPFQNILSLSNEANDLRVTTLMTNDLVFRSLNQDKYNVVVETCLINLKSKHVAWSQMGGPHLFLKKRNEGPQPISCFPESRTDLIGFPVPVHFLGSEPTISPRNGDLYLDKGDEIILLSSSYIPTSIWSLKSESNLADWTESLTSQSEEQPFWLGRLKLD
jgi:hypothetical protein